jgi:hypothetical protein
LQSSGSTISRAPWLAASAIFSSERATLARFSPIFGSIWMQATLIGLSACMATLRLVLRSCAF